MGARASRVGQDPEEHSVGIHQPSFVTDAAAGVGRLARSATRRNSDELQAQLLAFSPESCSLGNRKRELSRACADANVTVEKIRACGSEAGAQERNNVRHPASLTRCARRRRARRRHAHTSALRARRHTQRAHIAAARTPPHEARTHRRCAHAATRSAHIAAAIVLATACVTLSLSARSTAARLCTSLSRTVTPPRR